MAESVCVFVVEDDGLILVTLEAALGDGGFQTTSAMSGPEAVALIDGQGDQCRALVTDVNLGGTISGWEVARHARSLYPSLPVVYVTAESADDWAVQGVPNSVLISKPFVDAQIVTAVATLLNAQMGQPAAG